jgi:Multimeric flavodoxin WrbA
MKIVGICASPRGRKSRTLAVVSAVLESAGTRGADVETIDIAARDIGFCDACDTCHRTGTCWKDDDFSAVLEVVKGADGVVLGSPVYIDNVSGQMKAFMDRMADAIHYQVLSGKYGCSVSSTWESGGNEVTRVLDHFLHYLGAQTIEGLAVPLGDREEVPGSALQEAGKRGEALVDAIKTRTHFPDQERWIAENRDFFETIVSSHKKERPDEYALWVQRGWIRE